jgi:hypothetical protein
VIGAATQRAFAKGNGFLYQRLTGEWNSCLSCETSPLRVEEESPMSARNFIALVGDGLCQPWPFRVRDCTDYMNRTLPTRDQMEKDRADHSE